jgi:CDP-glucose 4,6-dehydratase
MENMVGHAFSDFYRGKKIFLTGHTGFKGSWMLAMMKELGAEVTGYALLPDSNTKALYHIIDGDTLCNSVIADIRDIGKLKQAIEKARPDIVFHLAAQPLVRYSYTHALETFEVNTMGTANLLEAVKDFDHKCVVVVITTDKVYENNEWHYPYRETDRLGGYDPYSASKAAAEIVTDSYRNSFFNTNAFDSHQKAVAVARAGNVIGGGDWSMDRIIPDIIRALENKQAIMIRNPASVRPWQHVLEPLAGYLLLGARLWQTPAKFSSAWNFGPYSQDTFTVSELVQKAIEVWGEGKFTIEKQEEQPHEAGLLKLDINKAINVLGWHPAYSAAESITHTMEWYRSPDKRKMTIDQVRNYLSSIAYGN